MDEVKIDERTVRIQELQAEYNRRKSNAEALRKQHMSLLVNLKEMDQLKTLEIEKTLDSLPDASPKGLVDKVLQLADPRRDQLLGNVKKMEIALKRRPKSAACIR